MSKAEALLWLDLETTGGDIKYDKIIEVGAVVTDYYNYEEIMGTRFRATVLCPIPEFIRLMNNEVVREMHAKNGLITDMYSILFSTTDVPEIPDVDAALAELLYSKGFSGETLQLAGSGVSAFDRPFVKKYMPKTEELLIRPEFDIGHVRRFLVNEGLIEDIKHDPKSHRALDDVYTHIEEAKRYRQVVSRNDLT